MHPRNRHRDGYDLPALAKTSPELSPFLVTAPHGGLSIDFANPAAVHALNGALLRHDYGIEHWDIPLGYLTPPVPGRADYLHALADLLAEENNGTPPRGERIRILDIGVGANCVYPIVGRHEYGWSFVGSEIDAVAVASAREIVARNSLLRDAVEIRHQRSANTLLGGVTKSGERFAASICNPPFHTSAAEATAGTRRKLRNLSGRTIARDKTVLNFAGRPAELWCDGGEVAFVRRLIAESARAPELCGWFTSLVAKSDHLPPLERALKQAHVAESRVLELAQGQKRSRVLAWQFARES